MRKKILSLALALALCLGLTIPAFATETTYTENRGGITITLTSDDNRDGQRVTISYTGTGKLSADLLTYSVELICTKGNAGTEDISLWIDIGAGITSDMDQGRMTQVINEAYPQWGLIIADINFKSASQQPTTPTQPDKPAGKVAYASTQAVLVDGKKVEFQMYALKDANGNGTNYIKLRDMAYVLNGTKAQFSVGYDNAAKSISLTTGQAYAAAGGEMTTPFSGDRSYSDGTQSIKVNGRAVDMTAITLLDDAGGGYNYFKLRDLGAALGFNVGWSKEAGVFIESDKPYAG